MSAVFSKPKTPPMPQPQKTPTRDDAVMAVEERDRMRRRRGRASTVASRSLTRTSAAGKASKVLLSE